MAYLLLFIPLLFGRALSGFPAGRCYSSLCNASPYMLKPIVNNLSHYCFEIGDNTKCSDTSGYDCCKVLATTFNKVVLSSNIDCKDYIPSVMVDGVKKGGGVYFDTYPDGIAELRITSLNLNKTTAIGRTLCLVFKAPCGGMDVFCKGNDGTCKHSFFDPIKHLCCPTCPTNISDQGNPNPSNPQNVHNTPNPPNPSKLSKPPIPPIVLDSNRMECNCTCFGRWSITCVVRET